MPIVGLFNGYHAATPQIAVARSRQIASCKEPGIGWVFQHAAATSNRRDRMHTALAIVA